MNKCCWGRSLRRRRTDWRSARSSVISADRVICGWKTRETTASQQRKGKTESRTELVVMGRTAKKWWKNLPHRGEAANFQPREKHGRLTTKWPETGKNEDKSLLVSLRQSWLEDLILWNKTTRGLFSTAMRVKTAQCAGTQHKVHIWWLQPSSDKQINNRPDRPVYIRTQKLNIIRSNLQTRKSPLDIFTNTLIPSLSVFPPLVFELSLFLAWMCFFQHWECFRYSSCKSSCSDMSYGLTGCFRGWRWDFFLTLK